MERQLLPLSFMTEIDSADTSAIIRNTFDNFSVTEERYFLRNHTLNCRFYFLLYRVSNALPNPAGWLADRCSVSQQSGGLRTHTTDTFLFISHTTNVLLFKFRCNIFNGVRIIKEMPGSVASGTHCIFCSSHHTNPVHGQQASQIFPGTTC